MNNWNFRQAEPKDLEAILQLIKSRIAWMDRQGLEQWNKTDYFSAYPPEYFSHEIEKGDFYVLCSGERVIGAVALRQKDEYWQDDGRSCYVHNLASSTDFPGAGKEILRHCEGKAAQWGKTYLKLDCQQGNQKLNSYYERLGFASIGTVEDGPYKGIKREKRLQRP